MCLKRFISLIAVATFSLAAATAAFGDTLVASAAFTGKIVSMNDNGVEYRHHCEGGDVRSISWSQLRGFGFDNDCEFVEHMPNLGFISAEPGPDLPKGDRVYKIKCKNGEVFYAGNIFLSGNIFRAAAYKKNLTITCSGDDLSTLVSVIAYPYLTAVTIPAAVSVPKGFKAVP